jgi:GH15 family glucan-1,4-alpha-glucosidase
LVALQLEDYGFIGNCLTGALVGRNGSIDWLPLPRFDAPACFAALLGRRQNGRWMICPKEPAHSVTRRYRPDTLILETRFRTPSGSVLLIDFMPLDDSAEAVHVVRLIRGEEGTVPMRLEAIFRFDYGNVAPWVRHATRGLQAIAGPDALSLHTPLKLAGENMTTVSEFSISAGSTVPCVLTWYPSNRRPPPPIDAAAALSETESRWRRWCQGYVPHNPWRDETVRSLVVLKALTYGPTGGIVAAPTTSLPEVLGGSRNWDYRYCWLRDATFTLYALLLSGYREEAQAFREWLLRAVAGTPSDVQIMYGIGGERRLPESDLPWLEGYERSRPVRVGNGAYTQRQTDVFGEVMDASYSSRARGVEAQNDARHVQEILLNHLEGQWELPDSGIWEIRGSPRRYTHSAVMAWVAFDRGVKLAERGALGGPLDRWRAVRDDIHRDVCTKGFDPARNSFVQSYGAKTLDAALLRIPLVGFLPPSDPRVVGTVDAIERELVHSGFVRRYETKDGSDNLPAGEGTFLLCSFWLADSFAMMGRARKAKDMFERLLAIRNDLGLLAEEYDPATRRLLGNFPQAFSHVGLINTAHNLALYEGPAGQRAAT